MKRLIHTFLVSSTILACASGAAAPQGIPPGPQGGIYMDFNSWLESQGGQIDLRSPDEQQVDPGTDVIEDQFGLQQRIESVIDEVRAPSDPIADDAFRDLAAILSAHSRGSLTWEGAMVRPDGKMEASEIQGSFEIRGMRLSVQTVILSGTRVTANGVTFNNADGEISIDKLEGTREAIRLMLDRMAGRVPTAATVTPQDVEMTGLSISSKSSGTGDGSFTSRLSVASVSFTDGLRDNGQRISSIALAGVDGKSTFSGQAAATIDSVGFTISSELLDWLNGDRQAPAPTSIFAEVDIRNAALDTASSGQPPAQIRIGHLMSRVDKQEDMAAEAAFEIQRFAITPNTANGTGQEAVIQAAAARNGGILQADISAKAQRSQSLMSDGTKEAMQAIVSGLDLKIPGLFSAKLAIDARVPDVDRIAELKDPSRLLQAGFRSILISVTDLGIVDMVQGMFGTSMSQLIEDVPASDNGMMAAILPVLLAEASLAMKEVETNGSATRSFSARDYADPLTAATAMMGSPSQD